MKNSYTLEQPKMGKYKEPYQFQIEDIGNNIFLFRSRNDILLCFDQMQEWLNSNVFTSEEYITK